MSGSIGYCLFTIIIITLISNILFPIPISGDVSIATIIETKGMVRDSFSGSWSLSDGNGTNGSGVYSDSEMTNGGNFSLNKNMEMYSSGPSSLVFDSQKIIKYSSEDTGGHLIADEYIGTNSEKIECLTDNPLNCSYRKDKPTAAFSVINAHELEISSIARYGDNTLDYSLATGTKDKNISGYGLIGTLRTRFTQESETKEKKIQLYDRTYVSGLIQEFSRLYHSGEDTSLIGTSSVEGSYTDKTYLEMSSISNTTMDGIIDGNIGYLSDIIDNGGDIDETKQIQVTDKVSSDRMITFQSDGSRSIQAGEKIFATQYRNPGISNNSILCAFTNDETNSKSLLPYQRSSAETSFSGVSSAEIESSSRTSDPADPNGLTLEYRADVQIPIGFNEKILASMKDINKDGRYEDLNGNNRLDLNDIVLLFSNYRWISESNISTRIDFNMNNRVDYADIVTLFRGFNLTKSTGS